MSKQKLKKSVLIKLLILAEQSYTEKSKDILLLKDKIRILDKELTKLRNKDLRVSSLKYELKKCRNQRVKRARLYAKKIGLLKWITGLNLAFNEGS